LAVWSTADTHFGHAGALALCRRPVCCCGHSMAAIIWLRAITIRPRSRRWMGASVQACAGLYQPSDASTLLSVGHSQEAS